MYKDQLNPVAELDGAGNVVARFVYVYGRMSHHAAIFKDLSIEAVPPWKFAHPQETTALIGHIENRFFCITSVCGSHTRRVSSVGRAAISCPVSVDAHRGRFCFVVTDPAETRQVFRGPPGLERTRIAEYDIATDMVLYSDYLPEPFEACWFMKYKDNNGNVLVFLNGVSGGPCISITNMGSGCHQITQLPSNVWTIVAASSSSTLLACTFHDGRIGIVDLNGNLVEVATFGIEELSGACFSPDSNALFVGGRDLVRWDLVSGDIKKLGRTGYHPFSARNGCLWYLRDSRTLCCCDRGLGDAAEVVRLASDFECTLAPPTGVISSEQECLLVTSLAGKCLGYTTKDKEALNVRSPSKKQIGYLTLAIAPERRESWPIVDDRFSDPALYHGPLADHYDFSRHFAKAALKR